MAMQRIFSKLGGLGTSADKLASLTGRKVDPVAVKAWVYRGKIPGWAMLGLMECCEREGIACYSSDFKAPTGEADGGNTTEIGQGQGQEGVGGIDATIYPD